MILISFLGTGNYQRINYKYGKKEYSCEYFTEALVHIIEPETIYVFQTNEAKNKHGGTLSKRISYKEIIIPPGNTRNEMWIIFDKIVSNIPESSEIIFDITHGFRSQPILALASMVYLKALKNVNVKQILYGAYEARDEQNNAPVFDLKPFLDLMDWSYGVYEFTKNGNTKEFRKLLSDAHTNTYSLNDEVKAKKLKVAGNILEEFSNAMSVVNINDMLVTAKNFKNAMPDIIKDTKNISEAKPFGLLIDRVKERMNKLGMPYNKEGGTEFIRTNAEIIRWYLDTEQYQQAITLMTEIIITVKCILNFENPYSFENRKREADIIGKEIEKVKNKEYSENELSKISILYEKLGKVRNEINHGGMKEEVLSTSGTNQIKRIKEYFKELEEYIEEELKDAG